MRTFWKFLKLIFSCICLLGLIFFYAIFIEPHLLITEQIPISSDITASKTSQSLTIAQFSDTHLGFQYDLEDLEKAVAQINSAQPDIIVFTGDLIDHANSYDQIDEVSAVLAKLEAPLGKFAVYGNHDYGGGAKEHYQRILAESDFTLLINEVFTITLPNGKLICIGGLDEMMLGHPNIAAIENGFSPVAFNLLLLHEPDILDDFEKLPHVALAGHSHGGQVQIPFYGPLISTAYAEKYNDGLYLIGPSEKNMLYVNTGLGTTKLPMRFANPPAITFYQIEL